jgi:hypothetical protein
MIGFPTLISDLLAALAATPTAADPATAPEPEGPAASMLEFEAALLGDDGEIGETQTPDAGSVISALGPILLPTGPTPPVVGRSDAEQGPFDAEVVEFTRASVVAEAPPATASQASALESQIAAPTAFAEPQIPVSGGADESGALSPGRWDRPITALPNPLAPVLAVLPAADPAGPPERTADWRPADDLTPGPLSPPGLGTPSGPRTDTSSPYIERQNPGVTGQISRHLADVIPGLPQGSSQKVEIVLDPPELGRLHVHLEIGTDVLKAQFSAERTEIPDLLRRSSDQLLKELSSFGFGRIDLSFQGGGSSFRQPGGFSGSGSGNEKFTVPLEILETVQDTGSRPQPSGGLDVRL